MAKPPLDFAAQLPDEISGWKKNPAAQRYTPKTLYNYINGGAELYNSYCFHELTSLQYVDSDGSEIQVDIFDMGHPFNAYGVFSHGRESISKSVGQGSEYSSGLLTFFKDRYYVSLLAYPVDEAKKRVVFELAKRIDDLIPRRGTLPRVVSMLPRDHLVEASVRFFYHPSWLNSYFHVAHENVLELNSRVQAVLAKYKLSAGEVVVLLVLYPDLEKAQAGQRSFAVHYLGDSKSGPHELDSGRWAAVSRAGRLLVAVLRGPSSSVVSEMITAMSKEEP